MKNLNNYKGYRLVGFCLVVLTAVAIAGSCTKYPDPPPYFEKFDSTDVPLKRKVLLINVVGMPGPEIKKIQPPFIMQMLDHSKYSWKALTDKVTTDAATWETMMTGLTIDKHQVRDSTFEIKVDQDHLEDVIPVYPTFLSRLQSTKPALRTFAASPWANLNQRLLANVNKLVTAANDQVVKDSAVSQLKHGNSDLLIVDFNSVNIAGKDNGFSASVPAYKQAVLTVDGYVKEMLGAIKNRPDYETEQWLVILTSTHGGDGSSYGGKSLKERQVFTAYYNPHFESLNIPGLNYDNGVQLLKNDARAVVSDNNGLYNFGNSGEYTVVLRIKPTDFGSYNPAFFSKTDISYGSGHPQWDMMFVGGHGNWRSYMVSTSGSQIYIPGDMISLNVWHTLALKVFLEDGKRKATVYTDGKPGSTADITGLDVSNDETLKLGHVSGYGGGTSSEIIKDVRIWKTALPDAVIDSMACKPDVDELIKDYKDDLIGYWPCNDGSGNLFKDLSPSGNDFELEGDYLWDLIETFEGCAAPSSNVPVVASIRNIDIAPQIFYWLRIGISEDWGWMGTLWLDRFENEFYKKKNTQK